MTFEGPRTLDEAAGDNPFLDRRFDVTFRQGARELVVPGYFAADGDAAETGATAGAKWRVHFVPDSAGTWAWQASFRAGTRVAVAAPVAGLGTSIGFDGAQGTLEIVASSDPLDSPRGRGMLRYVGERYLRFSGSGEVFLEAGPNSPENLLAFEDFDGTRDLGGVVPGFLHRFDPHVADFVRLGGGPTWQGGRGAGLLGALSYLGEQGMNSIYAILLTRHGDGDDVWPWRSPDDPWRYDCSKLDQWARVFHHATERGIHLQLVLTETENESFFEVFEGVSGFADSRKLYYREMVARFGHSLALTWNLGEENGWDDWSRTSFRAPNTEAQRRAFSGWIDDLDPWDHPVVVHTYHGPRAGQDQDGVYGPLTDPANPARSIDGASLQGPFVPADSVRAPSDDPARNNHAKVRHWIERSAAAGHPWVVGHHEQLTAAQGTAPDGDARDPDHDVIRQDVLWGTLMAGGSGAQFYFGYDYRGTSGDDLTTESFRHREDLWRQARTALEFFREHVPVDRLDCRDELVADPMAYCLAAPGDHYIVYFRGIDEPSLDLGTELHSYEVLWFDPRHGGALQAGSHHAVAGPGVRSLGLPAGDRARDWVAVVRRIDQIAGSGCQGSEFVSASGPARLGTVLGLDLPAPSDPRATPLMVLGFPRLQPDYLTGQLACHASTDCRIEVDGVVHELGIARIVLDLPGDPSLLGNELIVQGAHLHTEPTCLEVTGALRLPFVW